jgi:hypothetical protein
MDLGSPSGIMRKPQLLLLSRHPCLSACREGLRRHHFPTRYGLGFVLGDCLYYDIVKIMTGDITNYRISAATWSAQASSAWRFSDRY